MIGWYVHHQGRGHAHRATAVARHLPGVVGLSSLPAPTGWSPSWVQLPRDDDGARDATAGGTLHWAPLDGSYPARMSTLAAWVGEHRPELVVVDTSVEVSLLLRLLGVPVLVVVGPGERTDRPHRAALDAASQLLAPWPSWVQQPGWPTAWRQRVHAVGAFSRYDERSPVAVEPGTVTVLWGDGGLAVTPEQLLAAVRACPDWRWTVLGGPPLPAEPNLRAPGWVDDPWPLLASAEVVITHAGQNALAEVAAARRPTVVLPQDRPHAEQKTTAEVLRDAGLATICDDWPSPACWPELLAQTVTRDGASWRRWNDGAGAERAAAVIAAAAAEVPCAPR